MKSDSKKRHLSAIPHSSEGGQSREKRSLLRVQLSYEQFRLKKNGKVFSVTDLSEKGMGLYLIEQEDVHFFCLGDEIEGTLNLKHEKYLLSGNVRNIHQNRIGIEFSGLSSEVSEVLHREFSAEALGRSLRLFPSSDKDNLWYRGSSGLDFLLRFDSKGVCLQMTLYLSEQLIQWDLDQGFTSGKISLFASNQTPLKNIQDQGVFRLEARQVKIDLEVNKDQLLIAKKIILSSNLPEDFKKPWLVI